MLCAWYNESRHKSRALSNCLTCINNTEPWQGKLVLNVLWPPFLSPSLPCYKLLYCLSGTRWRILQPLHTTKPHKSVGKQVQLYTSSEGYFLNIIISLNWLPCLQQRKEVIQGHNKSSTYDCEASAFTKHTLIHTHTHTIGSYLSGQQMEVLWTAARTEMWLARLSYHNPADTNVWLQPQATAQKKDRAQNA